MISTSSTTAQRDPSIRFGSAIQAVFKILYADLGASMTSLLVGGSVCRDTNKEGSDIDVFATFDGDWWQRRRFSVAGSDVDLFINPTRLVRSHIGQGRDPVLVYNYADGWSIFDPNGILGEFRRLAREVWSRPRQPPSELQIFVHGQKVKDTLSAVQAVSGEDLTFEFLLSDFVESAIAAYYVFTRRWRPPQAAVIADLASVAPSLLREVSISLDSRKSREAREAAASSLHEFVLATCEPARSCTCSPRLRVSE